LFSSFASKNEYWRRDHITKESYSHSRKKAKKPAANQYHHQLQPPLLEEEEKMNRPSDFMNFIATYIQKL
jgi:hypothetical protein